MQDLALVNCPKLNLIFVKLVWLLGLGAKVGVKIRTWLRRGANGRSYTCLNKNL